MKTPRTTTLPPPPFLFKTLLKIVVAGLLLLPAVCLGVLSIPDQQIFIPPYPAEAEPRISSLAEIAKPIAIGDAADESGNLQIKIASDVFETPMDIYFGFKAPSIFGDFIMIVNASGVIQPISSGLSPWKSAIEQLDEQPLGEINLAGLPGDTYTLYLLVTKAGNAPLQSNYYLWQADMTLTPTMDQLANTLQHRFPNEVDGPMAILLAYDNGYSATQVINALHHNKLNEAGFIYTAEQQLLAPELIAPNLITAKPDSRQAKAAERLNAIDYLQAVKALKEISEEIKNFGQPDNPNRHIAEALFISMMPSLITDADPPALAEVLFALKNEQYRVINLQDRTKAALELLDSLPDDQEAKVLKAVGSLHGYIRNRPPQVVSEPSFLIRSGEEARVELQFYDPDYDELQIIMVDEPKLGTLRHLSNNNKEYDYRSKKGETGDDFFTFQAFDGFAYSELLKIEVVIKPLQLQLDKVVLWKSNGNPNDDCPDSSEQSTSICIEYFRFGSFEEWTDHYSLQENSAEYAFVQYYVGGDGFQETDPQLSDYRVKFSFESPPKLIVPGEQLPLLKISGSQNGYIDGWYLTTEMIYYIRGINGNNNYDVDVSDGKPQRKFVSFLNRDLPWNEEHGRFQGEQDDFDYTSIIVPDNAGDGFVIGAKFNWDPGLYIEWVYKLTEADEL